MWILRSSRGDVYYLLPGKEHVVGRKDGDLILADDQSISRKHAVLSVEHNIVNWNDPEKPPVVTLTETSSKYGTVINRGDISSRMAQNSKQELFDGDQVQFGMQWNIWRIVYEPLIVVMSTVPAKQKKEVKEIVGALGGHLISDWKDDCTHVTMCNLTLTVKAICALAYGKPIVTPSFWKNYTTAIKMKTALPNYEDFIPPLAETIINKNEVSFHINTKRRTLFQGKTFLFFSSQQYEDHSCLVTAAGGAASVLDKQLLQPEEVVKPHVIILQHFFDFSSQNSPVPEPFITLINYLQSKGKRVIPVHEIGLAILHCSIEKYCNPNFSFASSMLNSNKGHSSDVASQIVLTLDTQDNQVTCKSRNRIVPTENITIPESGSIPKQQEGKPKTDEYDATLSLGGDCFTNLREPERRTSATINTCSSSSDRLNQSSQKRPTTVDVGDEYALRRHCISKTKNLDVLMKTDIDTENMDSIPFASDKRHSDKRQNEDEEDAFAFTKLGTSKRQREESDEDMFAFTKSETSTKSGSSKRQKEESDEDIFAFTNSDDLKDTTEMQHSPKTKVVKLDENKDILSAQLSNASGHNKALPMDITQPARQKRKLSDVHENVILDDTVKKLALDDVLVNSHGKDPIISNSSPQDFLSVKRKDTTIKMEPDSSLLHTAANNSIVTVKALVISSELLRNLQSKDKTIPENENLRNFKKFRKMQGVLKRVVPCIIGGQDLVVHADHLSNISRMFGEDHSDKEEEEEEIKDNWAFVTVSQVKKQIQRKKY